MCKKAKEFLSDLGAPMILTRRDFLVDLTVTALSALLLGFLLAPPRNLSIGCNNQISANTGDEDEKPAPAEKEAAASKEEA